MQAESHCVFLATEVRCQEKTRGGLCYEVILGEPEVKATPPKQKTSPRNSMSVQDIEEKLRAAEERRQVCSWKLELFTQLFSFYCSSLVRYVKAYVDIIYIFS